MDKRFLNCKVRKYWCPYCGHWHRDIANNRLAGFFPSLSCPDVPYAFGSVPQYTFNFSTTHMSYSIKSICSNVPALSGNIDIEKFREVSKDAYVASVIILNIKKLPEEACTNCRFTKDCVYRRLSEQAKCRQIAIKVGFSFSKEDFERITSTTSKYTPIAFDKP